MQEHSTPGNLRRTAPHMKKILPLIALMFILLSIVVHATLTNLSATGGSTIAFGDGFDSVSGTFADTATNNSVYFAIQQNNGVLTADDLQGFLNLTYNLSGISGMTPAKLKNLSWYTSWCYSNDVTGAFSCVGTSDGTATNPMNVSWYNNNTGFYTLQYGYNYTIAAPINKNFSVFPTGNDSRFNSNMIVSVIQEADIALTILDSDSAFGIDQAILTVEADLTAPNISVALPINNSVYNYSIQQVPFLLNLTDDYGGLNGVLCIVVRPDGSNAFPACNMIAQVGNVQIFAGNYTPTMIGNHTVGFLYSDDVGNQGGTGNNYLKFNVTDLISPSGVYQGQTPPNNSYVDTSVVINVSVTDNFATGVCTLNFNGSFIPMQNITLNRSRSNCYLNQSVPEGISTFNVVVTDSVGNSIMVGARTITRDTIAPVPVITYPTNVLNWGNGTIQGFCAGGDAISFSYTSTNATFLNISLNPNAFTIIDNHANESHNESITFNCLDGAGNVGSITKLFLFDLVSPECIGIVTPVTVVESTAYQWNLTCIDDINYFSLNVTCTGGTAFQFYDDNINATAYPFSQSTGPLTSNMHCLFISTDAHTLKDITNVLNVMTVHWDDHKLSVPGNDRIMQIENSEKLPKWVKDQVETNPLFKGKNKQDYISPAELGDEELSFSVGDRVSPTILIQDQGVELNTFSFIVAGDTAVQHIQNSDHHAWFVVDKYYWVDFDLLNDDGSTTWLVYRLNATASRVVITSRLLELQFASVGITNTNIQDQQFYVLPADTQSAFVFNQCPVSLNGTVMLGVVLFFALVLILFGILHKIGLLVLVGAMMLTFVASPLLGCSQAIGTLVMFFGLMMMLVSFVLFVTNKPY